MNKLSKTKLEIDEKEVKKIITATIDALNLRVKTQKDLLQLIVELLSYDKTFDAIIFCCKEEYRREVFEVYKSLIDAVKRIIGR